MPDVVYLTILIVFLLFVFGLLMIRRCILLEYHRGLLYKNGKFIRVLQPGPHWYVKSVHNIVKVDVRTVCVTISGQEVLSLDNVGVKVSLAVRYRVSDPYLAINKVENYQEALYLLLQIHLRDIVGMFNVEELLAKRGEIGKLLFERSTSEAATLGIELLSAGIKDLMFPGELRSIFNQVINAKNEGLAALERARGESAALRCLANGAHVFDNNPNLLQLRLLQTLEKSSGNTVVIMPPDGTALSRLVEKKG